jgi:hypothetical protein
MAAGMRARSHGNLLLHLYGESREYFGPSRQCFGNLGIFREITFGDDHGKTRSPTHGELRIFAVEFGSPVKARVPMTCGNSSQLRLPHQKDPLPLLEKKAVAYGLADESRCGSRYGEPRQVPD